MTYEKRFNVRGVLIKGRAVMVRLSADRVLGVPGISVSTALEPESDAVFCGVAFVMRDMVISSWYERCSPLWTPSQWLGFLICRSVVTNKEATVLLDLPVWNEILTEASQAEAALAVLDA